MFSGFNKPLRVAIFISGSGSTLQSILEMHHQIDVCLVVSNKKDALGRLKAKRFGKKLLEVSNPVNYEELQRQLLEHRIDRILLAGYMKMIPAWFVEEWKTRMMNVHPSLLPAYPGLNAAEKSFGDRKPMGVTIHQVNAQMDEGEIFLQLKSSEPDLTASDDFVKAQIFLRRTEQHLLRELAVRWN